MSYNPSNSTQGPEDSHIPHSRPIPISFPNDGHPRQRSASMSSGSVTSSSPTSPFVQTPLSNNTNRFPPTSPSTSPILTYFLGNSPTKAPATLPLMRGLGASPVFEEEDQEGELPSARHARRATSVVTGRFPQQPQQPQASYHDPQRGAGLLRRLSLGGTLGRTSAPVTAASDPPPPPPNSAVAMTPPQLPELPYGRKARRATLAAEVPRQARAPSPMGERILKGHFDGFN